VLKISLLTQLIEVGYKREIARKTDFSEFTDDVIRTSVTRSTVQPWLDAGNVNEDASLLILPDGTVAGQKTSSS